MEKFTASNGVEIEPGGGAVSVAGPDVLGWDHLTIGQTDALREYFQAERDAELGRWRWSEHTDVVVRVNGPDPDTVEVYDEDSGLRATISRGGLRFEGFEPYLMRAGRAYFDAHPEPRPWENAQEGEVWVLTGAGGVEQPWRRDNGFWLSCTTGARKYDAERATAGRRIWPEGETTT